MTAADPRIKQLFHSRAAAATSRVIENGGKFIYYTTAETAYRILRNKEIWMRNTLTMNDYLEVEHGLECVVKAYRSASGAAFESAIDGCFPGLAAEIRQLFEAWAPGIRADTFVTCVSEFDPQQDVHGRLSMWRAYGGRAGVALVLNGAVMFSETDALAAYSSPVAYMHAPEVDAELTKIASAIKDNAELLRSLGRDALKARVFHLLRFAAVCTKHPGFQEEREWRVVASPLMDASDLLRSEVEVVHGIPQTVLKIALQDKAERGLLGLEIPKLLDHVIVGPCEHPTVIRRAIHQLLVGAGVPEDKTQIVVSNIPLRV